MSHQRQERDSSARGCCHDNTSCLRPLDTATLRRLQQHVYSCEGSSLLEPLLQPWWCWLVARCPTRLAPNLITLVGLLANMAAALTLVLLSPDATAIVPRWSCVVFAAALFFYQSMDAIDGKQARRTNSASPLGELFDHGCDSVSVVCVAISVCIVLGLGEYPGAVFTLCLTAQIMFYQAHWLTFVTGKLRFGYLDVTEEQVAIMILFLVSAILGPQIWDTRLGGESAGIKLKLALFWCGLVPTVFHLATSIMHCRHLTTSPVPPPPPLPPPSSNTSADTHTPLSPCKQACHNLAPGVALLFLVFVALCDAFLVSGSSFTQHRLLFLLTVGVALSKITCLLVVAHMSRSAMCLLDRSMLSPVFVLLADWAGGSHLTSAHQLYLLSACLCFGVCDFLFFWFVLCRQISRFLGVFCFTLPAAALSSTPAHLSPPSSSSSLDSSTSRRVQSASDDATAAAAGISVGGCINNNGKHLKQQ